VNLTIKDIWTDYKNFRRAYYFISTSVKEDPPLIDAEKFSLKTFTIGLFDDRNPNYSQMYYNFTKFFMAGVLIMLGLRGY
jgi:hypothetical protein